MSRRIGIFGGSFNPPHRGHGELIKASCRKLCLDYIYVIPSYQTEGKKPFHVSAENRLKMVKESFKGLSSAEVLDIEIKRKKISRTSDTLMELYRSKKLLKKDQVFLILGSDLFSSMDQWKNFKKLIQTVQIAVCVRESDFLSYKIFPKKLRKYILKTEFKNKIALKNKLLKVNLKGMDQSMYFFKMDRFQNLSSKQVRDQIKKLQNINSNVYQKALSLIKKFYMTHK